MSQFDHHVVQQNMEETLEQSEERQVQTEAGNKFRDEVHQDSVASRMERSKGRSNGSSLVCEFPILQPGVNVGQIDDNSIIVPPLEGTGPGQCFITENKGPRPIPPVDIPMGNRN